MILIKTKPYNLPSYDAIEEFESAFNSHKQKNEIESRIIKKILQKILEYYPDLFTISKLFSKNKYENIFTILMAAHDIYKIFPFSLNSKRTNLYLYDLWEKDYKYFENILNNYPINNVFLSSKQTTEVFNNKYKNSTMFHWLPEAIADNTYRYLDYKNKNIDILSFGRKYESYHQKIVDYTLNQKINYIYQKDKIVFSSKDEFIDGLSRSKISLCFPANITHNTQTGNISKITMRYFQSMASKCLILGKAPDDMKYLFDYNPVIDIEEENSVEQLNEILNNFQKYIPLIEKNYNEVTTKHLYKNRVDEILKIIENIKE